MPGTDYVYNAYYGPHLNPQRRVGDRQTLITRMLERVLTELAMNRFEWTGLPESVSPRWLELQLISRALSVFFYDDVTGRHLALAGGGSGAMNPQGDYTQFQVWGNGAVFLNRTLDARDCVPIWSNFLRQPDTDIIEIYSQRIAAMDRTIEINSVNARHTKFLGVTENGQLTAAQIQRQIESGASTITVAKGVRIGELIEVLDLGINPDTIVNMDIARGRQWNAALTLLGINNANQDKKERLVAAEVSGNDDEIENIRAISLQSRQLACDQINAMWPGLNVSVDFKSDMNTPELKDTATGPGSTGPGEGEDG